MSSFSCSSEMELRSHTTTAIVVVYLILLIIFLVYEQNSYNNIFRNHNYDHNCSYTDNCIQFCVSNVKYSDDALEEAYQNISHYNSEFLNADIKILVRRSSLVCESFERKVLVEDLKGIQIGYYLKYDGSWFRPSEYCLEAYEKSDQIRLNAMFCEPNHPVLYALDFLFVILTCIFLVFPLVIYLKIKDLRNNFHGKICIAQLILQLGMVILFPLTEVSVDIHGSTGIAMGIFALILSYSANFCVTLMCYDIFMTFRNYNNPDYVRQSYLRVFLKLVGVTYAVIFCIYLLTSESQNLLEIVFGVLAVTILVLFFLLLAIDVFLLVITYIYIARIGKSPDSTTNTKFSLEQERYFLYIRMFVIFSIMWAIEFLAQILFSYEANIVADVIKIISSVIIAQSLLINPKVRVFLINKYISFKDTFEDADTTLI